MEYQENNLKSREELAKMAMDMIDVHLCYTGSIRSGASKEEVRANARDYFRKRDELMEASRSILFNAKLTER